MEKAKLDDLETLAEKYVSVQNAIYDSSYIDDSAKVNSLYEKKDILQRMMVDVVLVSLGYGMDYESLRLVKRKWCLNGKCK